MKLKEICAFLDRSIPLAFQESYDNSGLQTGDPESDIVSALLCIDVNEVVLDEAINTGCNLILSHHPVIFHPIRSLTGKTSADRIITRAIKENIAIYSAHTNLDISGNGVSRKMAEKLGLQNVKVLAPLKNKLLKLVTYVPSGYIEKVSAAVFDAGAGVIGNYDRCGFNTEGYGTFRGNESTRPFKGKKMELHRENETRFETILLSHLKNEVIKALLDAHPYEEVAYDLYLLENEYNGAGLGCIGELPEKVKEMDYLIRIADLFGSAGLRYSSPGGKMIGTVALCGGSGVNLINDAIRLEADIFITGDVKYHDFQYAAGRILLADIGHFEGEKFATEILYDLIIKKFPTFALRFSEKNTNPIYYL